MRTILLIDMDYFFAACEELRRPELKSRAVIVGADPKAGRGRGVVSTCNYIARKYGIHSAMPISIAYRLKPDAVFLPVDYDFYDQKSKEVMGIAKDYADAFEQASIDEVFIDVSKQVSTYAEALKLAEIIKRRINDSLHLPCSIGIGPNKLIAKIACESAKPNGLKLVKEEEAKKFLEPMHVNKLYGVGEKTTERLLAMGYKTIGDLANANLMELHDKFGVYGVELHKSANGIDESEVQDNYEVKSIGREQTFDDDTSNAEQIVRALREMSDDVGREVRDEGIAFKVVTLKTRYANFDEHLKSKSMNYLSNDARDIANTVLELFWKNYDKEKLIRKIGVRVSNFRKYKGQKKITEYST